MSLGIPLTPVTSPEQLAHSCGVYINTVIYALTPAVTVQNFEYK